MTSVRGQQCGACHTRAVTNGRLTTSFSYDAVHRLASMGHVAPSASPGSLSLETFGYNPAGQIASRSQTNPAFDFAPAAGPATAYAVNGLNQYTTVGGAAFTYDANGNLTSDGSVTYTYDAENRLISAVGSGTNATLAYDPYGRLHSVQGAGGAATRTVFVYDGDALIAEYSNAGNLLRRYLHGPGVDDPLIWFEGSGTAAANQRALARDWRGSVVAAIPASGAAQINTEAGPGLDPATPKVSPAPDRGIDAFPLHALSPPSDDAPAKARLFIDALHTAIKAETVIATV